MAIKFQYNKTALQDLGKQLAIREGALPILKNKESALRVRVNQQKQETMRLEKAYLEVEKQSERLIPLVGRFPMERLMVKSLKIRQKKIAGVLIPVLDEIELDIKELLWHEAPHWYPDVFEFLKELAIKKVEYKIAERQLYVLEKERKRTTQKVNLYEKVQIPDLQDAMKKIKKYLEDKENLSKAAQKIIKARKMSS
jgi:V/A-type H+-transporting ATPase subunit D